MQNYSDLSVEIFKLLRRKFFDEKGAPVPFPLRDKKNTQDDPLDEYISALLKKDLPKDTTCVKSPGPLITPDLVVLRPSLCQNSRKEELKSDATKIMAVEVKKLERSREGKIARPSGLDYNTTPPCGMVRVYDSHDAPLDIRCFYLFICLERDPAGKKSYQITALTLCDGNVLNQDFDYYLAITGERTKKIGLGTYKDGFNRERPMVVFANPLGAKEIDRHVTLIHPEKGLEKKHKDISPVHVLQRTISGDNCNEFYCYRTKPDVPKNWEENLIKDPFPTPERVERTQGRGKFKVDLRLKE